MELRKILDILYRRIWIIIWTFVLVVGGTIVICLIMTPVYEAVSRVVIEARDDSGILLTQVPQTFNEQHYIMQTAPITQAEVMNSGAVIDPVIDKLGLKKKPTMITAALRFLGLVKSNSEQRLRADDFVNPGIITAFLQRRQVLSEALEDTDIVEIFAYSDDLDEAKEIANAVAHSYLEVSAQRKSLASMVSFEALQNKSRDACAELRKAQEELQAFQSKEGFVDLDAHNKALVDYLSDLEKALNSMRQQMEVAKAVLDTTNRHFLRTEHYELFSSMEQVNPTIQSLKMQKSNLTAELSALLAADFTELHPKVIEQKNKIKNFEQQIKDEVEKTFSSELNRLNVQYEVTRYEIDTHRNKMKAWPTNQIRYADLKRAVSMAEARFNNFENQMAVAKLASDTPMSNAALIQEAVTPDPTDPYYPQAILYTIIALFVAGVFGSGLALLIEYMDDTLRWEEQVKSVLKLPVIGRIITVRPTVLAELGPSHSSPFSEACLDLTHRLMAMLGKSDKTVMICSPSPREGKSTIISHVGVYLSNYGLKTVLIDLNLYRPSLHKRFRLLNTRGVSDYINGDVQHAPEQQPLHFPSRSEKHMDEPCIPAHFVIPSSFPNLSMVTIGSDPGSVVKGIYSERFRDLVEWLKGNYDVILVDTPALTEFRGVYFLGHMLKQAVMIIKMRSTVQVKALYTKRILEDAQTNIIGVILNRQHKLYEFPTA